MPRTPLDRLLDTLALILSPLTSAWDQEFGGRAIDYPRPQPEPPPAAPVPPPADAPEVPVSEPVEVVGLPGEAQTAELVTTPTENREANDAPAEPLYVARGEGRGRRYDMAPPDATGQRWRKVVAGRRTKFVPVEVRR